MREKMVFSTLMQGCIHKTVLLVAVTLLFAASSTAHQFTVPGKRMPQTLALRESLAEHYWPAALPPQYERDLASSVCVAQSLLTRHSVEPWSMQMWDSSGTSVVGAMSGNHQARGHQGQCTAVRQNLTGTLYQQMELLPRQYSHMDTVMAGLHPVALNITSPPISGRYCIVTVRSRSDALLYSTGSSELLATLSNHNTPSYATCVPDTCSENLLQTWFQSVEGKNAVVQVKCTTSVTVLADEVDPQEYVYTTENFKDTFNYLTNYSSSNMSHALFVTVDMNVATFGTLLFCAFAGLLLTIVLSSTAIDYFNRANPHFRTRYDVAGHPASSHSFVHSQQHQIRQVADRNQNTNVYIQTLPPVYGWELLQCFSIPQNWQRIFPEKQSSNALPIVDGLRCMGMFWVIVVHRYMLMLTTSSHPGDLTMNRDNPSYAWLFNAYPSVDIFFLLSGFLLGQSTIPRSLTKVVQVYVLRYLRLAPSVIVTVWGVSTALAHMGSGPVWDSVYAGMFGEPCQKSWLSSVLLMSNFYHPNDMCMGHIWSLSIDWQISLIGILVLLPLNGTGSFCKRYLALLILTILSVVIPGAVSLTYKLPPVPSVLAVKRSLDYYNLYYVRTYCRAAPYCVGLLAARLHLWLKNNAEALTTHVLGVGHSVSLAVVSAVMLSPAILLSHNNVLLCALHNSLAKPAFAAAISFLIIASSHGQGGLFGWLLSQRFVGLMARSSYCIYLVSLPIQIWSSATSMTVPSEAIMQAYLCGGDVILSTICGIALTLLVEMPCARILGYFIKKSDNSKKQRNETVSNAEQLAPTPSPVEATDYRQKSSSAVQQSSVESSIRNYDLCRDNRNALDVRDLHDTDRRLRQRNLHTVD